MTKILSFLHLLIHLFIKHYVFFLLSNVVFSKQPQPNPQFPCTNCIFYKTFSQRSPLWLRDLNYITCSVTELCLTLCDPMDYSLPGSSIHGILQARILECCHFLLQGIFPTQGLNLCLLHWQVDSLPLSHQGSPHDTLPAP